MEHCREILSSRSPKGRLKRIAETTEDVLFDSFSESRENSTHGPHAKAAQESRKSSLFQFLSDAAVTLRDQVLDNSPRSSASPLATSPKQVGQSRPAGKGANNFPLAASTRLLVSDSQEKHNDTPSQAAKKTQTACSRSHLQEEQEQQLRSEPEDACTFFSNSTCQLGRSPSGGSPALGDQPVAQKNVDTRSTAANELASEGSPAESPAQGSHRGHGRSSKVSGSGATLNSDSAEGSFEIEDPSVVSFIPSGMGRTQGSWTSTSLQGSIRSMSMGPHCGSVVTEDSEMPTEVFYDFPSTQGRRPSARWAHASAVVDDKLFIFGGAGGGWHSDSFIFHAGKNKWMQIVPGKEAPPATYNAAACSSRGKVFLFGGKQSQKHSRRLYTLDPASLQWRAHKDSTSAPPACAAHTMTSVGQHGIYVFGGEGRKLSNQVHALDPVTLTWSRVSTLGAVPPARQCHTAVWDGADSLIVYGGNHGDRIYGDVRVLSLSTGFWSEAACRGALPPPRHSHTAVLFGGNLMLVWGGCGERGAVLSDAYLLNTSTFVWHKMGSIGSPPPGRYCHTCNVVGERTLIFGGTNARQSFDSIVGISTDFGQQLGGIADSLSEMAHNSLGSEQQAELVRMQLGNHLRQRHAVETSQVALARAEIAERLFEQERQHNQQLTAELQHLKLVLEEEEARSIHQRVEYKKTAAFLKRAKDMEMYRANELQAQLRVAMETIQRQEGEAVVVDGYKAMYDRLVAERVALVERAVDLEHQNQVLRAAVDASRQPVTSSPEVTDPWAEEFDKREGEAAEEKQRQR